ncbi:MAG: alpha-ketoacid dehydrogenase subunit beta [Candidatus Aenigmarchaeota archaeon]|nr:alpha-ketoacid dehydrogenase subunit beta [Candidatus Aenigmarchaeota archaeon]
MPKLNIVEAVNLALMQEMEKDKTVVVLGEDVGRDGGVFRATAGLLDKFGPNRVLDTPLAESGIIGVSIGMAVNGLRPIAEVQFEGFLPPAFDQLVSHAARIRTRSRGRYTCPLVVRCPWGGGIHAPEHHSDSPEAYFVHTPGLKVVLPSTPYDTKGLLVSAIRDPDPVIFFEPKRIYRAIKDDVPEEGYTVPIGKAAVRREGKDVTIISWGASVRYCLEAAEKLKGEGIDCEVMDLRTLSPIDSETIIKSVEKTRRALIVHEAPKTGGLGAEISSLIMEKAILHLEAPAIRVAGYDTTMPLSKLENYYLPDTFRVIRGAKKVMGF